MRAAECIGRAGAAHHLVYLHGMDAPTVSTQEQANRAALTRIAQRLDVRIAMPRATTPCPTQPALRCWGWTFDDAERARTKQAITDAAATCFGAGDYGVIGFSNGGAAIGKAVERCEAGFAQWSVQVASAGFTSPTDLPARDACGTLRLLVGDKDEANLAHAKTYVEQMKAKRADVELTIFAGGHELPERELEALLRILMSR